MPIISQGPKIKISDIVIKDRQRKIGGEKEQAKFAEYIEDLAESIKRNGLIHPILLNREDNSLNAGFCRIQAHLLLGLDEIEYRYAEDLNPFERKLIELEENLKRKNLEWWEELAAISELHALHKQVYGKEWTIRKTAAVMNSNSTKVHGALELAEEIKKNPELKKEKNFSSALNKVTTRKKMEKRKAIIEKKKEGRLPSFRAEVVVGKAEELIVQEEDESFDAVITNFPFGIDLEFKGGNRPYDDEEDYIVKVVRKVVHESYRILRPDSWFVGFFDMRKITYSNKQREFVNRALRELGPNSGLEELAAESLGLTYWLEEAGFSYIRLTPCVWVKPNKRQGIIGDPKKGLITAYEAFVFAAKGDAILLKQGQQDVFIFDTPEGNERVQSLQMSREFCRELVSMVCLGGSRILDPFAGSATIGLGALDNQCEFKGYELYPDRAEVGNILLAEHEYYAG